MRNISYLLIGLLCALNFKSQAQNDDKNYDDAFKLINVWLNAQKDFESIPAISATVVRDQEIIWSGVFGESNVEERVNAELSTRCSICSVTKTFTAVAVMKLIDDGKIKLDDKVKDILPHFTFVQSILMGELLPFVHCFHTPPGCPGIQDTIIGVHPISLSQRKMS